MSLEALKAKLVQLEAQKAAKRVYSPLPCIHLAEPTGAFRPCNTCGGSTQAELMGCRKHGICTEKRPVTDADRQPVRCCLSCPDKVVNLPAPLGPRPLTPLRELPAVLKRNLLFHLLPVPGRWQYHAEQLRRRIDLFNGRRVLAVATQAGYDSAATMAKAFPDFELIEIPNDRALREVATFQPLFSRLTPAEDEVTLYAQGKGVTRPNHATIPRWVEVLYLTLLDHWPAVETVLRRYPLAGSFKKVGQGWRRDLSRSDWHYSGSWFWFRNHELLSKSDWQKIDPFWSGIEPYPSLHFQSADAGVVFLERPVPQLNLYNADNWRSVIEPALAEWLQERTP